MGSPALAGVMLCGGVTLGCAEVSGLREYSHCSENCSNGPEFQETGGPDVDATARDVGEGEPDEGGVAQEAALPAMDAPLPALDSGLLDEAILSDTFPPDATASDVEIGDAFPAPDSGRDASGRQCWSEDGGPNVCDRDQHCCLDSTTQEWRCADSCNAPESPLDCVGSTGAYPGASLCGSRTCCATLTLNGGAIPNCTASGLNSFCTDTCTDLAPAGCSGSFTVRLCGTTADCSGRVGASCCRFGPSLVYWCVGPNVASFAAECRK